MFPGYREYEGFLVPELEREKSIRRRISDAADIETVAALCPQKRVVVQAGGNWGLWPLRMAAIFKTVYTFEPDPVVFGALAFNTLSARNVVRFQSALGCERRLVSLASFPDRSGKQYVNGSGNIPTLRIDDLGLTVCDLIYLDVEGFELPAMRGAEATIAATRPVIAFEDKGLSTRFEAKQGDAVEWLKARGYRMAQTIQYDKVMVPA